MRMFQVVVLDADEIVKEFKPTANRRMAEKIENGVNINLNHERYYTEIREVQELNRGNKS